MPLKLFRFRRPNSKYLDEETPLMLIIRVLIILLLFGAVFFGFWLNNERRMDMLNKPQPVRSSQHDGKFACGAPVV